MRSSTPWSGAVLHDVVREAHGFRIRPVRADDAPFIVGLRTSAQGRFIGETSPELTRQEAWLEAYFHRAGDYYFVVESTRTGRPQGTVSIYGVTPTDGSGERPSTEAEFGRWVLLPESAGAMASALLAYRFAFDDLGLDSVFCRTVADNHPVVSLNEGIGLEGALRLPAYVVIRGVDHDAIEQRMTRQRWAEVAPALERRAARIGSRAGE